MKHAVLLLIILAIQLSSCGFSQPGTIETQMPTRTNTSLTSETAKSQSTSGEETIAAISSLTPLAGPCSTPTPLELTDFLYRSITIEDNGKSFVTHVTSRFWIYLDDKFYPLQDLINSIPNDLIGYVSNGSIRGLQCYPIMFEAIHEGRGFIQIKDFQLSIIVDNNMPESLLPLHYK